MSQFTQAWLGLIVDTSIKSIGLAVVAGAALFALRVRDANLRHRVWTAVMLGMLAMPALVHVTPAIPLPSWLTVAMPDASAEPRPVGDSIDARLVPPPPRQATAVSPDAIPVAESGPDAFSDRLMDGRLPPIAPQPYAASGSPKKETVAAGAPVVGRPSGPVASVKWLPLALVSLYLVGAAIFVLRLLIGLWFTHRLIGRACAIDVPGTVPFCEVFGTNGDCPPLRTVPRLRKLRLLESAHIHVPATVGFLRPVVLLPASWREWSESKLRAALAHELAHVRRADWLVITLAELNRAIYWFHPLAWFLRRRLSDLAELNCDDAVLEADGDRTQYARHLLEVATTLTAAGSRYRPPLSGVAMARKPNVETRIDAILDAGRPLARRIGKLGAITLLVVGATAILLAAALRTVADDGPKKPPAEMEMKGPLKNVRGEGARSSPPSPSPLTGEGRGEGGVALQKEAAARAALGDKQHHIHGKVLDPDGKPVAGATVYAAWATHGAEPSFMRVEDKDIAQTRTDSRGNYELTLLESQPDRDRTIRGWYIATHAPGFGPSWCRNVVVLENEGTNRPTDFELTKDQPVRGRFVDLEGKPLAGVHVRVYGLRRPESAHSIGGWLEDSKKKHAPSNLADYFSFYVSTHGFYQSGYSKDASSPYPGPFPANPDDSELSRGSLALPGDAVTDQDGRVEFKGLGPDRLLILEIQGPTIATSLVQVVTRSMSPLSAQPSASIADLTGTYYGGDFQFVAGPAQAIVGKVTDAETGEPLRNLEVYIAHVAGAGQLGQHDFLTTRTDDKGRYRLDGAARGGGHAVKVSPTIDQPYFPIERVLDRVSGFAAITCDFALRRGRWITGKLTNRETKAPIKGAFVEYSPLRDNEHAKDYPNYDPKFSLGGSINRYRASADGSFRVLAIPGRGILAAIAYERPDRSAYLTLSKEMAPKDLVQDDGILKTYHPRQITNYDALKVVDLLESNGTANCDLELTPGLTRSVKLVDARGEPVKGVRALGRVFPPIFEEPTKETSLDVIGLRPNEKRDVVFIHRERRIGKALTLGPGDELTVELQPCAVARGRVVNEEGQPVRDLSMRLSVENRADIWSRELLGAKTGNDGRFEVLLPPGTTLRIWHYHEKPAKFSVSAEFEPRPGAVYELGDLVNGTKLTTEQTEKMVVDSSKPTAQESRRPDKAAGNAGDKQYHVHGRVLDPDGKPLAGATVYAAWAISAKQSNTRISDEIVAKTQSDAQGNFDLSFPRERPDPKHVTHGWHIAAFAAGFGPAWRRDVYAFKNGQANSPTTLTLTKSQPIDGRIVDLEGTPLAGIHVRVFGLKRPDSGKSVAEWIADTKKKSPPAHSEDYFYGVGMGAPNSPYPAPFPVNQNDRFLARGSLALPADAVTDRDGRVHLDGLGADQLATLEIEGPSIAKCLVQVVARPMEPIPANPFESIGVVSGAYYGAQFQFVAGPTQPIVGTVTDVETGQPLADLDVHVQQFAGNLVDQGDFLATRTDEHGRFKLLGAPRGGGHRIEVAPTSDRPYFPTDKQLEKTAGFDPITCDFALRRGRWIVGKVIDRETNTPPVAPLGTTVEYLPLRDNEHAKDYPNYDPDLISTPGDRYRTSADGSFRVLAIPGRGILAAVAHEDNAISGPQVYALLSVDDVPKHLVQADGFLKAYHPFVVTGYNALKEVNLAESQDETSCDLQLRRGLSRPVKLVDAQGLPVKGACVLGRRFGTSLGRPIDDSAIEITGLRPIEERVVAFIQPERRIGKTLFVGPGDEITVALEPCAVARGRVVDEDGKPVGKLTIHVNIERPDGWGRELLSATTGDDGRFEALLPSGMNLGIGHYHERPVEFRVSADFAPKPGAVYELGDLTNGTKLKTEQTEKMVTSPRLSETRPASGQPASLGETRLREGSTIHGRVLGLDGKPAAGADVAVIAWRKSIGRGGESEPLKAILAETKTDDEGRFRIELRGVSSKTHRDAKVIARASGTALAWRTLNPDIADVEASFELQPEEAISGRLVDLEGQPAAGVHLMFSGVTRRVGEDQRQTEYVGGDFSISHLPAPFPQAIVSDAQGRFLVPGVPKNCGVELYLEGDDRLATQDLSLNTGPPQQRDESDGSYRSLVKSVKPGEEAVLVLAPAQVFTGTVRYEDTGETAPHTRLMILSAQKKYGGMLETAGQADEHGRYRISPRPGTSFVIWAYPPDHTPYFLRQIRFIPWEEAARSKVVDVTLPRGVLVKGKVVEQGSDAPIAGASVQYLAGAANRTDKTIAGWPTMHVTDDRGEFEIAVPSGSGNIVVRAPRDEYVFQETSDGELIKGRPGGQRKYAHGVERINPAPNSPTLSLDFHLKRGSTVRGELVDTQGTPIEEAVIISRLNVDARMLDCNAAPVKVTGGRFEMSCLAPEREYPVHFLDAKRHLGATVMMKAGMPSPRVVLEPCGAAKMRFVDLAGQPIAKCDAWTHLVVTPGSPDRRSFDAPLAADTVFAANVDHINYPQPERADDRGCLTLSALIPGATYHVEVHGVATKDFQVAARETLDLGDIKSPSLMRRASTDSNPTRERGVASTIHGRIVGVDGKPAEGVDVAVIAWRKAIDRGGDLKTMDALLGESKTDADGQYRIELDDVSSKTHRDAHVMARASGTALAWRKLNLDAAAVEASFELKPEEAISGRLVDIEGQPAAGVRFQVSSMMPRVITDQWPPDGIGLWRILSYKYIPLAWPKAIVTDAKGHFVIHGVPKDHGISLEVEGSDSFAPQDISLNTGMAEQRGERDGTYRPLVKNFKPGEEAVLPLAPAQLFTGTVRYEDTGEPAPLARLTIWTSQQEGGSMTSVAGRADEQGRYKINPKPGIRFGVAAYPPDGTSYLARQAEPIKWENGARSKVVDMKLPRGVLIQGKVLEEGSEAPIAVASVQYAVESANNPNKSDNIVTEWQDIHLTDKEGRFKIVVLPGPGRLLVHGPGEEFVLQEIGSRELNSGKPGGQRNYAHAIERIDPAANATPPEIVIRLKRGATVRGELVDRQGNAVDQANIFSRLHIDPASLWWRGFAVEARGGRFEVSGLAPEHEYPVSFLDSKRRLGATLVVKAGMPSPRVVLKPCGSVTMRFVDDQGKPVANYEPTIELVVTPGRLRYSTNAMDSDKFAADADFIANVDRANHSRPEKSREDGRLTVSALIPGADYHLITYGKQKFILAKEFKATANETIDLGDITVERKD